MNTKTVFVVGAPRSGTHLLKFSLSKSPMIWFSPETAFMYKIFGGRFLLFGFLGRLLKRENSVANVISELLLNNKYDKSMLTLYEKKHQLENRLDSIGVNSWEGAAHELFGFFESISKATLCGEKTPGNIFFLDKIYEVFPDAKVIFINRNKKNIVASMMKAKNMNHSFESAVAQLIIFSRERLKYDGKMLEVNYESLIDNPAEELQKICTYLCVEYCEEMLVPGAIDSSYEDEIIRENHKIGFVKNKIDKWKEVISLEESKLIDLLVERKYLRAFIFKPMTVIRITLSLKWQKFWIAKSRLGLVGIKAYFKYR